MNKKIDFLYTMNSRDRKKLMNTENLGIDIIEEFTELMHSDIQLLPNSIKEESRIRHNSLIPTLFLELPASDLDKFIKKLKPKDKILLTEEEVKKVLEFLLELDSTWLDWFNEVLPPDSLEENPGILHMRKNFNFIIIHSKEINNFSKKFGFETYIVAKEMKNKELWFRPNSEIIVSFLYNKELATDHRGFINSKKFSF